MQKVKLMRVRMIFPDIFRKGSFNGQETKYSATFLIPKEDQKTYKQIMDAIDVTKNEYKDPKIKVPNSRLFIMDGDEMESEYTTFENHWVVRASNTNRPTALDRDKSPLQEEDDKVYSGVYVNAIIAPWIQDNNYGKRINASLLGIQFVEHGEPLGGSTVASDDDFDDLDFV